VTLVSGAGNVDPVGIPVRMEDNKFEVEIVGIGRIGVTSVIGAVPDGNVIVGTGVVSTGGAVPVGNERVETSVSVEIREDRSGGEDGNTSEVGITRPLVNPEGSVTTGTVGVGAVGPAEGSVMPVVDNVTVGSAETTSEITEETSDRALDTTEEIPGRSCVLSVVVSEVGIAVGLEAELAPDSVAAGAVSVPRAVVIPTTIPPEESVTIGD
jgi:hypothetical protein